MLPDISLSLFYLLVGGTIGLLASTFGIGGGIIMVPLLAELLTHHAIDYTTLLHTAIGSSLGIMVFTTAVATWKHYQAHHIHFASYRYLLPTIIIGAPLGAQLGHTLSTDYLSIIFASFITYTSFILFKQQTAQAKPLTTAPAFKLLVGFFIGLMGGLLGVGGGILVVPFLLHQGLSPKEAVGTSSACTFPIALAGTLGVYLSSQPLGWQAPGQFGYFYLPAIVPMSIGSIIGAPAGVKLIQYLPAALAKRLFAGLLLIVAIRLIWRTWIF